MGANHIYIDKKQKEILLTMWGILIIYSPCEIK
jgi:hypothetical protein